MLVRRRRAWLNPPLNQVLGPDIFSWLPLTVSTSYPSALKVTLDIDWNISRTHMCFAIAADTPLHPVMPVPKPVSRKPRELLMIRRAAECGDNLGSRYNDYAI
jgi:hypothetical protein